MYVSRSVMFDSLVTPWIIAHQASLSMEFSRQEYWSMLPFPSAGDIPDPEIEPGSLALLIDVLPSELLGKPKSEYNSYNLSLVLNCIQNC